MSQYLPVIVLVVLAILFGAHHVRRVATAGSPAAIVCEDGAVRERHRAEPRAARAVPGQLLRRRDAVHHVRHRDHLPLPVRGRTRELGTYGFVAILIFSALFFLTFVYEVARGGLDWGPLQRSRNLDVDARVVTPERTRRRRSGASAPKVVRHPRRRRSDGTRQPTSARTAWPGCRTTSSRAASRSS